MSKTETTICFFKDLRKTLDAISDEDAGILMKALFAVADGDEPEFHGSKIAQVLFTMAADQTNRLNEYRRVKAESGRMGGIKSGQVRSKNEANVKQNEANVKQNEPPYPSPYPSPVYIGRSNKIQERYGFSTERKDVDYNELARMIREAEERQAQ